MSPDIFDMPKLRAVEPIQTVVQGKRVIALKDPLQLTDRMICVGRDTLPLLAMLDGKHSLRDIQANLTTNVGRLVFVDEIKAILDRLDESFLLEGEKFRKAYESRVGAYREMPYRPSSHAGKSYHEDPAELRRELDSFFEKQHGGPGHLEFFSDPRTPTGLVAPHIDIRAGSSSFANAYHALASGQPSDIYVILGTGHAGVEALFTAGSLDFHTPLGIGRIDRELLDRLSSNLGKDPASEEILHATEHVIEFQLIFLQHLFSGRRDFTILPILCSFSHHIFNSHDSTSGLRETFFLFCSALKQSCRETGKSVCFIASADLDHIGPRYGDHFVPHDGTISQALEKDTVLLHALEKLGVDDFVQGVASDGDARRICGFSPITAMLHCMEAQEGKLLSIDYARVDDRNSFVSFASMIFY